MKQLTFQKELVDLIPSLTQVISGQLPGTFKINPSDFFMMYSDFYFFSEIASPSILMILKLTVLSVDFPVEGMTK